AFRWHVADRIPYQKHLRATIEDGLMFVGKPNSDYASVAFYYQVEPHSVRSTIRGYADLEPIAVAPPPAPRPGTREAEALVAESKVSQGFLQVEQFGYLDGPSFSGNSYVAWANAAAGAEMTMSFGVAASDSYDAELLLGQAADGVIAEVWLDERRVAT